MDQPNYVNIDDISLKREENKGDIKVIASLLSRVIAFSPPEKALLKATVTVQK